MIGTRQSSDDQHETIHVPFVIRGQVVYDPGAEHLIPNGRLVTPDPVLWAKRAVDFGRRGLADLHELSFDDIIGFLTDLGQRLRLENNVYMQEAFEHSVRASRLTPRLLRTIYERQLDYFFRPDILRDAAERRIGIRYLEGWVPETGPDGRRVRVRAYGARTTHVVAGNSPGVSAVTIVRNAMTRGDAIIKAPSNDPMTAVAIVRTMAEMAPNHPLVRHLSVLYWKGGDRSVEEVLLRHPVVDKVVVWGGADAVEHFAAFAGPGVELIALDPKVSMSLLGKDVLLDSAVGRTAAARLARDVGMFNQEGCVNARIAFVDVSGVDDVPQRLEEFAQAVFTDIGDLSPDYSTPAAALSADLRSELEMAALFDTVRVVGGGTDGGVVISTDSEPVEFAHLLSGRHVNLVPVHGFDRVIEGITSTTQTVGVFPQQLKDTLSHELALAGVQRIVTLGGATNLFGNQSLPQDGIEVLRRMCRWIIDEDAPDPVNEGR
jgi:Acyl-CoA reductase (LuxC)